MRLVVVAAVSLAALLAGCSDGGATSSSSQADSFAPDAPAVAGAGRQSVAAETVEPPLLMDVVAIEGHLTAAFRVPPVTGNPTEDAPADEPYRFEVPDGAEALRIELVWDDHPTLGRQGLIPFALSSEEWYYYGGGAGTVEAPAVLDIEGGLHDFYDLQPVADTVAFDQDYTYYVSVFAGSLDPTHSALRAQA